MEIEQPSHFKRLYGVQYSPNDQADRLEDYLGVEFVEKPRKILMTPRNRAVIIANSVLPPFRNLGLFRRALETEPIIGATYMPEYNLMFAKSNSPHTILHENMHAFAHQVNPTFFESGARANEEVLLARMQRRPHPRDDAERMWLVKIFDEGIAETGALHVLFDRNSTVTDGIVEPYNLALANGVDGDQLYGISLMNGIIGRRDIMERMIDEIKQRSQFYEPINWDDFEVYSQLIHLGVYFCQGAFNELRRNGLTTADAFTSLIKNPPTALEYLKNPTSFAQSLR